MLPKFPRVAVNRGATPLVSRADLAGFVSWHVAVTIKSLNDAFQFSNNVICSEQLDAVIPSLGHLASNMVQGIPNVTKVKIAAVYYAAGIVAKCGILSVILNLRVLLSS